MVGQPREELEWKVGPPHESEDSHGYSYHLYNRTGQFSIARWLKTLLTEAGVDTFLFHAHSVRGNLPQHGGYHK